METLIEPGPQGSCACTTLRKASRAVSRLYEDRFIPAGMTITQYSVLKALDRQPDQPLSRLAEAMVMDRTSLYRLIAPLEREGLVSIAAGAGRARVASMTPAGKRAMDHAAPVWASAQAEFLERFGNDAWSALEAVLSKMVAASTLAGTP